MPIHNIDDLKHQYQRDEWSFSDAVLFLKNWFGFEEKAAQKEVDGWEDDTNPCRTLGRGEVKFHG